MDAPPTLLPRPPRIARPKSTGAAGCLAAIVAPFFALGLGFVAVVVVRVWVQRTGTPVTVVVEGTTTSTSGGRNPGTHYRVQYRYDWAGIHVHDEQEVTADERRRAVAGARVPGRVRALLGGHPICLAEVGGTGRQTANYALGMTLFAGLPLVAAIALMDRRRRKRRLLATGSAVAGEVTAVGERPVRTSRVVNVTYRFHAATGVVDATTQVGDSDRGDTPVTVGQQVTVIYDPVEPTRNVVYEWSGYTVG